MKVDQLDLLLCLLAICHTANPAHTDIKRYKKENDTTMKSTF